MRELVEAMDKVVAGTRARIGVPGAERSIRARRKVSERMNIHEFQAKQILGRFGAPVPKGQPASSAGRGRSGIQRARAAQGGRQGADSCRRARQGRRRQAGSSAAEEAREFADRLLDKPLVTHQTGPAGRVVRRVYVEEASEVARELYLAMVVDRKAEAVAVIASTEGGMEIEEVAAKTPEKIITEPIDPVIGLAAFQARKIAFALGLKDKQVNQFVALLDALYRAFNETDASLIEINPLVVTKRRAA